MKFSAWFLSLASASLCVSSVAHAQTLTYSNPNVNLSKENPMVMNMTLGDCTPYGLPVNSAIYDIQYKLTGVFSRDWDFVKKAIEEGKYLDAVAAANLVNPDGGVANLTYDRIIDMIANETDHKQVESLQCLRNLIDKQQNNVMTLMAVPDSTPHSRFSDTLDASIDRLNTAGKSKRGYIWGDLRNVGDCYGSHAAVRSDCGHAIANAHTGKIYISNRESSINVYGTCFFSSDTQGVGTHEIETEILKQDAWMVFWNCFNRNDDSSRNSGEVDDYNNLARVCLSDRGSGC
ncbi:hypothetical protein SPOG_02022 [Schizosaccharomyces cryophilus OY26]|uniref:Uncharacterized protein n=1 Tax=Schizosaccharomyces cryophilus (strain OY26 / ATCC MYA-4695 / CBS 11777 / NBRC 106824 / NRRL Y48691) TaxID=653667 RepID=S9XGA8_SCHCR|nr:uncharacterized protein SPOG_02022 [Schizosaccharomyces cryophilus OY26]EPY52701.1 hypothetical protein SPOG_02022 [Schizosaccharomyces cryophilus OY26]